MESIRIRTDQAEAGMTVAADIYTANNQLIIPKGTVLDDWMITRLRFYNIYGLVIAKQTTEASVVEEVSYIEMLRNTPEFKKFNRTYVGSVQNVENNFKEVLENSTPFNIDALLSETNQILSEGRNGAHILEMLHGIRNYDDMTYVHSLNVSLICNVFAGWLKLSEEDTRVLTLCGLLHDIGKLLIPKEIISKAGKLTPAEFEIIKTHSTRGYEALKAHKLDSRILNAAWMHHERCDGSGYPQGLKGDQIADFAKIVAIADVYDAMTSDRNYRNRICPFRVVEEFEKDGFLKFDPGYLLIFLEHVVESYLHNIVRLNDGREGEVIMINKLSLSRPVIKLSATEYVDLSKNRKLFITEII